MIPTPEQIAVSAYYRWQRRGFGHGRDQEDWDAAAKDLTFGMNYRWLVRHALSGPALSLGQGQRCRFCERSAPAARFEPHLALPAMVGNTALMISDECSECRNESEKHLAASFEAFAAPLLTADPSLPDPALGIPVLALKALVRMALMIVPGAELHHFEDSVEWVSNPDPARDTALLLGLGCHVYITPQPVPSPFASLARRSDEEEAMPYMLFFLGANRIVFQTHLPFCPRDEDLEDHPDDLRGPMLSMSLGTGHDHRLSRVTFLPVVAPAANFGAELVADRQVPRAAGI